MNDNPRVRPSHFAQQMCSIISERSEVRRIKAASVIIHLSVLFLTTVAGCNRPPQSAEEPSMSKSSQPPIADPNDDELSKRWREKSAKYVEAVNELVRRGISEGWENIDEKDEPQDSRQPMASAVLDAVRRANESNNLDGLRERFPPAHSPFIDMLNDNGQDLPVVLLLDDGRIIVRMGAPYEDGSLVVIDDLELKPLSPDLLSVGRSPNRRFFAVARDDGVTIHQGWDGPRTAHFKWPTGEEGVPEPFQVEPLETTPTITQLIPFDTGDKALLVSPEGVFVLAEDRAVRLLPTSDQMKEHFEWLQKEYPKDPLSYGLSMEHGAISPDGKWVAAGHQSSLHYIFDAEDLKIVGEVGNMSEYPHYAVFSSDSSMVAVNSCHFYNGATIGVPTTLLPGLKTEPYEEDPRLVSLEDGSRVYAAIARGHEFIIGDANGFLRAFDLQGRFRWQHFIGSSIGDIDISPDGKRLVVTTYAGFLCILDLDTGTRDPFTIGTSTHQERRRWLFWKKEPRPLVW